MPPTAPPQPTGKRRLYLLLGLLAAFGLAGTAWYLLNGTSPAAGPTPEATTTAPAAPSLSRHIYSETANPKADIAAALSQAAREHKRVLVDFGGDWCGDCQVLDIYLHQPPNAQLLANNFLLVHVWIGHLDANLDIPAKYGIPINKGVPALAVLDPGGAVLYAQHSGEFENMRSMDPASVTEFLGRWKS